MSDIFVKFTTKMTVSKTILLSNLDFQTGSLCSVLLCYTLVSDKKRAAVFDYNSGFSLSIFILFVPVETAKYILERS